MVGAKYVSRPNAQRAKKNRHGSAISGHIGVPTVAPMNGAPKLTYGTYAYRQGLWRRHADRNPERVLRGRTQPIESRRSGHAPPFLVCTTSCPTFWSFIMIRLSSSICAALSAFLFAGSP